MAYLLSNPHHPHTLSQICTLLISAGFQVDFVGHDKGLLKWLSFFLLLLQVYSSSHPLRIGYYITDAFTMPSPSMKRAVLETKQLLEKAGHTVCVLPPCIPSMLAFPLLPELRIDGLSYSTVVRG